MHQLSHERRTEKTFCFRTFLAPIILTLVALAVIPNSRATAEYAGYGLLPISSDGFVYVPSYSFISGANYVDARESAMRDWYNTPTRIYPYNTSNFQQSKLDWYLTSDSGYYAGLTEPHSYDGYRTIAYSDVFLNVQRMQNYNQTEKRHVATHEMGHSLGLGHTYYWDSVMYPTLRRGITYHSPRAYDINEINRYY